MASEVEFQTLGLSEENKCSEEELGRIIKVNALVLEDLIIFFNQLWKKTFFQLKFSFDISFYTFRD